VPPNVEPAELADLIAFSERPRVDDWSLRAALTRYAQPQPQRVSDVLDLIRRIEFAFGAEQAAFTKDGVTLWEAVQSVKPGQPSDGLVGLLRATVELDQMGDALAAWAADTSVERPDATVDAVVADVGRRLDELGIPHEERPAPPRGRG
jgi:hypothetical protein